MMEVDEGGSGQTSSVDLDWELDGDVWHNGNQAREGNRSCPRKKEKIETETSLVKNENCGSILDMEGPDGEEGVEKRQELQFSTSDVSDRDTPVKLECEVEAATDASEEKYVASSKVVSQQGVRFSPELRRQKILEDLQKMPEVEVCKR